MNMYALIIFDLDGTLALPSNGQTFLQAGDHYRVMDGRAELIQDLQEAGVEVAIATNQAGVAFGYRSEEEVSAQVQAVADVLCIKRVYKCFYHPKASVAQYLMDSPDRKPGPGMLQEAMEDAGIGPDETLMVGDRDEDRLAAEAAHCAFEWSYDFFPVRAG